MTSFKLQTSWVGFAMERIQTHKWTSDKVTFTIGGNRKHDDIRRFLHAKRAELEARDDIRNITLVWSPGNEVYVPIDTVEEAFRLHDSEWFLPEEAVPREQFAIVAGSPLDGLEVFGPFRNNLDALDYGDRYLTSEPWWPTRLTLPVYSP